MVVEGKAFSTLPHYVERHQFIGFVYLMYTDDVPLHSFNYMNIENDFSGGFFVFMRSKECYHQMYITRTKYDIFLKDVLRDVRIDLFLC